MNEFESNRLVASKVATFKIYLYRIKRKRKRRARYIYIYISVEW